ncbi:MAG TPA: lysophospholipid acyltransferase family protein [Bdellovibrionales bacterium]|nr:lysophospholipid acyltransferase family protein [Bdellovibrionales bacterium]
MFRQRALGFILWVVYRTLIATWRVKIIEHPEMQAARKRGEPIVFAFWHGDELAMLSLNRYYKVATMVSSSRDGEIMNTAAKLLGMTTTRGSSTRGGARALLGLVKLAKAGLIPILAVDGPKGPIYKVKPGILLLSRASGGKIFPAGVAASRKIVFEKSWNKAYLPLPFARLVFVWGEPLPAVDDESRPDLAERLESLLLDARRTAANIIASS